MTEVVEKPKAKRGRPRKADIEARKRPGKVGRPAGDAARIQELRARLLSTTGDKVINKVVEIAMTDGHPVQGAALKMCLDRVLPLSYFEKTKDGSSTPQISINITGISSPSVSAEETVIETGITDVEYNEDSRSEDYNDD